MSIVLKWNYSTIYTGNLELFYNQISSQVIQSLEDAKP